MVLSQLIVLINGLWTRYRRRSSSASSSIVGSILVAIGRIRSAVCSKAAEGRIRGGRHGFQRISGVLWPWASTRHQCEYGAPNSYVVLVCVTKVPTPIPEKKIRSDIWWGLSSGIYGINFVVVDFQWIWLSGCRAMIMPLNDTGSSREGSGCRLPWSRWY